VRTGRGDPPDRRWRRCRRDHTTDPDETGIDIYHRHRRRAGRRACGGGAALHWRADAGPAELNTEEKVARAAKMGISDPKKIYTMEEMARGDVLFAATA
jgi:fructose-1,6-bisphosphatase II / sedoheptulose-1,7-bisphosphatase